MISKEATVTNAYDSLIHLQQARMNGAGLLLTVSLRLTGVGVTTRVAFGTTDV